MIEHPNKQTDKQRLLRYKQRCCLYVPLGNSIPHVIMYCTVKYKSGELDPANRKVFMYSGHDTTIAPILHTLGKFSYCYYTTNIFSVHLILLFLLPMLLYCLNY